MRDFFRSLYTSMEPCLVQILHSADFFNFWIILRTIQGITVVLKGTINARTCLGACNQLDI